jgi:hypothetical protein
MRHIMSNPPASVCISLCARSSSYLGYPIDVGSAPSIASDGSRKPLPPPSHGRRQWLRAPTRHSCHLEGAWLIPHCVSRAHDNLLLGERRTHLLTQKKSGIIGRKGFLIFFSSFGSSIRDENRQRFPRRETREGSLMGVLELGICLVPGKNQLLSLNHLRNFAMSILHRGICLDARADHFHLVPAVEKEEHGVLGRPSVSCLAFFFLDGF